MYIDKLDDIANEYNNTYHRTIKSVGVKDNTYIDSMELHSNDKEPKFKVGDQFRIYEYSSTKIFLLKDTHQIGLKKFL